MKTTNKQTNRKPTIYWDDLRCGYNDKFNTTYPTVYDFVQGIYSKHKTVKNTAYVLGISAFAFWKKTQILDICLLPKGHRGIPLCLIAIKKLPNLPNLTSVEIAKKTGFTRGWVLTVLKKYHIQYAKNKHFVNNDNYECIPEL